MAGRNIPPFGREVIAALAVLPDAVALMPAAVDDPDREIIDAWNERQTSLAAIEARGPFYYLDDHSPEAAEVCDAARDRIRLAEAKTLRGVVIKLWEAMDFCHEGIATEEQRGFIAALTTKALLSDQEVFTALEASLSRNVGGRSGRCRAALGTVIASAAVAAPVIAAPVIRSINPDADIISAWDQYREAHAAYCGSPDENPDGSPLVNGETALQQQMGAVMDEARDVIISTSATTLRGVEIQLWYALQNQTLTWAEDVAAVMREDVAALSADGSECGKDDPILVAIRSVRLMRGRM